MTPVVGFVGLGAIGKPMALRLAASELDLVVYDVAAEPVTELVRAGAEAAGGVAELAGRVDVLCVMVRDDDQVRDVLGEAIGGAQRGQSVGLTVAIHSTVAPDTPAPLADTAARHGVRVVDAPVSGGAMGAADGTLAIMAGGTDDAVAACRPVFDAMAGKVVHAGPIGAGTRMKLARNLLHFIAFAAATEAQRLAEAAGLDLLELGSVVRHTDAITGGPGAIMHRPTTAPLAPDDFWYGVFDHVRVLGEKDLRFAIGLADELDVEVPLARQTLDRLAAGLGLQPSLATQEDV
ncbi:NAD(P)-dependent oxidoreductase [Haloechinothrix halophila]|uniref:NAD(P)-dependent oxidoreductase n=1 Tax=Haloechinothrix halophila TaxID=1069073 RepID=UPI000415D681|nr:NAD(P)-dependent oxidoreductase [Haloechinothrix halophila]